MSATAFGIGRLLIWEDFAVGLRLSWMHGVGTWDPNGDYLPHRDYRDEEVRTEVWAMGALSRRASLFGRLPMSLVHRRAGEISDTGGGLSDVAAGIRYELLQIGEYVELPAIALTFAVLAPTGRSPDEMRQVLGADVTGRGAFALSAGISFEITRLPWFVRLDLGTVVPLPFTREDTGRAQRLGPEVDVALSGGAEVSSGTVLSLVTRFAWHAPLAIAGRTVDGSERVDFGLAVAGSVVLADHWSLQLSIDTGFFFSGAGDNTPARVSTVLGLRYGHY